MNIIITINVSYPNKVYFSSGLSGHEKLPVSQLLSLCTSSLFIVPCIWRSSRVCLWIQWFTSFLALK